MTIMEEPTLTDTSISLEELVSRMKSVFQKDGLYYAGVGSRHDVPQDKLELMPCISSTLEDMGYILRSGRALGTDQAFESGVENPHHAEIFIANDPKNWKYLDSPKYFVQSRSDFAIAQNLVSRLHPVWNEINPKTNQPYLTEYAKKLHCRNASQILGFGLCHPVKFVICCAKPTKNGVKGGTNMTVQIAKLFDIPVFNMYDDATFKRLVAMVEKDE